MPQSIAETFPVPLPFTVKLDDGTDATVTDVIGHADIAVITFTANDYFYAFRLPRAAYDAGVKTNTVRQLTQFYTTLTKSLALAIEHSKPFDAVTPSTTQV